MNRVFMVARDSRKPYAPYLVASGLRPPWSVGNSSILPRWADREAGAEAKPSFSASSNVILDHSVLRVPKIRLEPDWSPTSLR